MGSKNFSLLVCSHITEFVQIVETRKLIMCRGSCCF